MSDFSFTAKSFTVLCASAFVSGAFLGCAHPVKAPPPPVPLKAPAALSFEEKKTRCDALYREGLVAYSEGRSADARRMWHQCVQLMPGHIRSQKALLELNKKDPAILP